MERMPLNLFSMLDEIYDPLQHIKIYVKNIRLDIGGQCAYELALSPLAIHIVSNIA